MIKTCWGLMKGSLLDVCTSIKHKWLHRHQQQTISFLIVKSTPFYDAINGDKCGELNESSRDTPSLVKVVQIVDRKWAQLETGAFVKLSYLQLNNGDVTRLMATQTVNIYAHPSKNSAVIGQLTLGALVAVIAFTADRHFVHIRTPKIVGYVPFAHMKY